MKTCKNKKPKNSLKGGTDKVDFTPIIEGLGLFKAKFDKPGLLYTGHGFELKSPETVLIR